VTGKGLDIFYRADCTSLDSRSAAAAAAILCNLGSDSWLSWANGTAAIHCPS